jgi:hypothetical protein
MFESQASPCRLNFNTQKHLQQVIGSWSDPVKEKWTSQYVSKKVLAKLTYDKRELMNQGGICRTNSVGTNIDTTNLIII